MGARGGFAGGAPGLPRVAVRHIAAPLVSLLYLIYTRVLLEVIIALFRIMESNLELVQIQRTAVAGGPASAPPPPEPPASAPPPDPPAG